MKLIYLIVIQFIGLNLAQAAFLPGLKVICQDQTAQFSENPGDFISIELEETVTPNLEYQTIRVNNEVIDYTGNYSFQYLDNSVRGELLLISRDRTETLLLEPCQIDKASPIAKQD